MINNKDNPTLTEAMNGPDSAGFMVAMEKEIQTLIQMQAFIVVDKEPWINVVLSGLFAAKGFLMGLYVSLKLESVQEVLNK